MKRFITTILGISVFFIGLGTIVEKAGARFRSDDKALALIKAARTAIGGDSSIAAVQSLRIVGQTTRVINVNGATKTEQGNTEIAMQLPDKLMKTMKIGGGETAGEQLTMVNKRIDVVVVDDKNAPPSPPAQDSTSEPGRNVKTFIVKKDGGDIQEINTADGKKVIVRKVEGGDNVQWRTSEPNSAVTVPDGNAVTFMRHDGPGRDNELSRLSIGLLLSAPKGLDVNYTYGGEADVDGTSCELVVADIAGSSVKLFLNKDTDLPVMISYTGTQMPHAIHLNKSAGSEISKDMAVITRDDAPQQTAEFQVRFSDYRTVDGIQLPFHWTTNVNGALAETLDVTNYEINPANIAEKFQQDKVFFKVKRDGVQ